MGSTFFVSVCTIHYTMTNYSLASSGPMGGGSAGTSVRGPKSQEGACESLP